MTEDALNQLTTIYMSEPSGSCRNPLVPDTIRKFDYTVNKNKIFLTERVLADNTTDLFDNATDLFDNAINSSIQAALWYRFL